MRTQRGNKRPATRRSLRQETVGAGARSISPTAGLPGPLTPAQTVGQFFRATRQAQDLSQEQLASLTRGHPGHVSRAMISAIERGVHMPGVEVLLTLAQTLHVSPNEVIERLEMSRGAEIETAGLTPEEADRLASNAFWAGDHRRAAAYYDAMLRQLAAEPDDGSVERRHRIATLEVRRGTALRRCGVTTTSRSAIERAIALTDDAPELQAQAYVVLVALLVQLGCLPLARDAAERAVQLASDCDARTRGWAWIEKGEVLVASRMFREARAAFLEARRQVRIAGDRRHEIHVEGNIGACLHGMGNLTQARGRYVKAVELARKYEVPAAESLWLLELARVSFDEGKLDQADHCAQAALRVAKASEHLLTCFRAEWLRHRIHREQRPDEPDRHRLAYLRRLYTRLEPHRGIEEINEFRSTHCNPSRTEKRDS
jgi:transcriptional regulator with XRE-family HTH domain